MVWTLVEPGVAIIASSLATMRPLVRAMKIQGFRSTDNAPSSGVARISLASPNQMTDDDAVGQVCLTKNTDLASAQRNKPIMPASWIAGQQSVNGGSEPC